VSPGVSVILRVYNALPFLGEAIDSILRQSYRNFELLIVDNGSTDGSLEYARSVRDDRVSLIIEPRRGPAAATNAGIAGSSADLIAIMDADDVVPPQRLQTQFEFMQAHPDIVLSGTRFAFLVGSQLVHVPPQPREHAEIRRALLQGLPVIHNGSSMFRADAARRVGGHRVEGPGHDLDFFLRMSEVGKVYNLSELLLYYRLHDQETSLSSNPRLACSQAFAVACAKARMDRLAEPDQEAFDRLWNTRPLLLRLSDYAKRRSHGMYKRAIMKRAQKKHFSSAASLIFSAALSPGKVIWRVKRNLGRC
jgi:glycosyltransferase involved in cell wall biosynthesis